MAETRTPFVDGTIDDDPLTSGATTLTATELADLAAVASPDIAKIILDPSGSAGAPEVVYVTAHTGSATTATIVRAREGSTGRQHAKDIAWVHGPTNLDYGAWEQVARRRSAEQMTSATAADLASFSGLSIDKEDWILIVINYRKTAAAFTPSIGLKLNSTIIIEAVYGNDCIGSFAATNEAQDGISYVLIGPRSDALFSVGSVSGFYRTGGATAGEGNPINTVLDNAQPQATVTDVIIRGDSDGTNILQTFETAIYRAKQLV